VNRIVAVLAEDEGLSSHSAHVLHPRGTLATALDLQVSKFPDMVDFEIVLRSAFFAFVRHVEMSA
jgi:hypothetical protein